MKHETVYITCIFCFILKFCFFNFSIYFCYYNFIIHFWHSIDFFIGKHKMNAKIFLEPSSRTKLYRNFKLDI